MATVKRWLAVVVVLAGVVGAGAVAVSPAVRADDREHHSGWRHHDGHWSYWHEGDRRWYYTDGSNWFYRDGDAWKVYRFDKEFGREGFERGEYKAPADGVEVVTPRHRVYVPLPR